MRKIVLLIVLISLLPISAYALGGIIPFGGRIVVTHSPPNVVCPGDLVGSPFSIVPVGVSSPEFWSSSYGLVNVGLIAPSGWVLGLQRPASECYMVTGGFGGATYFPTFQTDFYGTSIKVPKK
jgi:hypothetical protein